MRFYINNVDFSYYGVEVLGAKGLFDDLPMKERTIESYQSENGVLIDRSATLFDKREIILQLLIYDTSGNVELKYRTFRGIFNTTIPVRFKVTENESVYVYDVDLISDTERSYVNGKRGMVVTMKLVETFPVKAVYKVIGSTYSFTIAKLNENVLSRQLVVSRGDGTFTSSRAATITHTYTDGYDCHLVIISGRLADVTITTEHDLLYTVSS